LFGCSCGEDEWWAVLDGAQVPQLRWEADGAAGVDGVVAGGCGGDEDHAVHGVHVQLAARVPAELVEQ
jgi:hypothetical protein